MDKSTTLKNEFKNKLTDVQNRLVEEAFYNISSILDVESLTHWCDEKKVHSVMIFGSRTRLQETKISDLDIMITDCDRLDECNDDNYVEKQRGIVDDLYNSFCDKVVKNKNIKLDFKLNLNRFYMEGYNGVDANAKNLSIENDFYFSYADIPSYFEIDKYKVTFNIADIFDTEDIFDENSFLEV